MKFLRNLLIMLLVLSMCLGMFACSNDDTTDTSNESGDTVSFFDYAVVRANKVPEALVDEVTQMHAKLVELSGNDNAISTDAATAADSNTKEILVGNTNRPETAEVYGKLAGNEYAVAVVGNKVVIVGTNERFTSEALAYFVETYLTDGTLAADLFYKGTGKTAVIVNSGKAAYTLVRNEYADSTEIDRARKIFNAIYDATGVEIPFGTDYLEYDQQHDDAAFEIIIGDTNYAQTELMKDIIAPSQYGIDFIGNKIVIYSGSIEGMDAVIDKFCTIVAENVTTEFDGTVSLYLDKELVSGAFDDNSYYVDVPVKAGDRYYDSVYDAYDSTLMLYWEKADEGMMDSYAAELETMNYDMYQNLDNDNIKSITYKRDSAMVHIYYLKRVGEFRVITQDDAQFAVNPSSYVKKCDVVVSQPGCVYLIRLEDGTFVVIDGDNISTKDPAGNATTSYDYLYKEMQALLPEGVDDIVISAWFITHGHGDHYGMAGRFKKDYADKVTCKMIVCNDGPDRLYRKDATDEDSENRWSRFNFNSLEGAMGGAVIKKGHTGEQFFFPGFTMTMLCTHEDLYPDVPWRHNDMSTAIGGVVNKATFTINSQKFTSSAKAGQTRFVFTGDLESVVAAKLCKVYYKNLKTDVMTVAHHGNANGGSYELYSTCDPMIALCSAAAEMFERAGNKTAANNVYLMDNCDKIIFTDCGTSEAHRIRF